MGATRVQRTFIGRVGRAMAVVLAAASLMVDWAVESAESMTDGFMG